MKLALKIIWRHELGKYSSKKNYCQVVAMAGKIYKISQKTNHKILSLFETNWV